MATSLKFNYQSQPYINSSGKIVDTYRPFIPLRLSYARKVGDIIYALIDSGSDRNLFPAGFAIVLGADIKKGRPHKIGGIGQSQVFAYTNKISFYLGTRKFDTEIDFSYEHKVPILGRTGFFDLFKEVKFSEKTKTIELTI